MSTPIKLLTVAEVARVLRVAPTTVRRMCESGIMPHMQVAPRSPVRIRETDLEEWINRHTDGGTND